MACADALVTSNASRISTLALGARLPTRGSMSYGPSCPDLFRRTAELIDKILRGAKPGDIPVEQPTKFELVINLTTAKALGLTIPDKLRALADEVIE
jgi:putative tryptophan/tyrosine transport system substrate-binding protein